MPTIDDVRWFLGDDKRSYGQPWQPYIEQSLVDGISAFTTAYIVKNYWLSGKTKAEEVATSALFRLAEQIRGQPNQTANSSVASAEQQDNHKDGQSQGESLSVADAKSVPSDANQRDGESITRPGAAQSVIAPEQSRVEVAEQVIGINLFMPWRRMARTGGFSPTRVATSNPSGREVVASVFEAFSKNRGLTDDEIQRLANVAGANEVKPPGHRPR